MSVLSTNQGYNSLSQSSYAGCGSYEDSITSSSTSSQLSVFSEILSAQSSIASSISDDFPRSLEDVGDRMSLSQDILPQSKLQTKESRPSYAEITSVTAEHRVNPRRSSSSKISRPPPLTRQSERKLCFVDNLVDAATQMVEVIWPISVVPCTTGAGNGRGVLPLRTYIEETLRRSRSSYSTLQVTLYYLILIKPFVPKHDFTMEQQVDCPAERALMCGRRMFLAALILASKYLQDRNYSAKAWSRMSGLGIREVNRNERIFLEKVNWKLHIPDDIYIKWAEVLLRHTSSIQLPCPTSQSPCAYVPTWKSIVPLLTPSLEKLPGIGFDSNSPMQQFAPVPATAPIQPSTPSSMKMDFNNIRMETSSHETTPTPLTALPRYEARSDLPPTPGLISMGTLPTPIMTPSTVGSNTPAASVCSALRSSMTHAMNLARRSSLNRCTDDRLSNMPAEDRFNHFSRQSSVTGSNSLASSPESMVTDRTRSSRASSISSVYSMSASMALSRPCLARQATCRNAKLSVPTVREEGRGTASEPIIISDVDMVSSPEIIDFTISEKSASSFHRHSKRDPQPVSAAISSTEKSRKRARPRGGRRSDLQEEVRFQLEEDLEAMMVDDDEYSTHSSPSPVAESVSRVLSHEQPMAYVKATQPPAVITWTDSSRVPVQKNEGKKRTCVLASALSRSVTPDGVS